MNKPLLQKIDSLKNLQPDTKAVWGKMTPQHMVEHLIAAFQMSTGELTVECFNPPEKLPVLKKFLLSNRPLPKDFVNPIIGPDLHPLKFSNLNDAVTVLENTINKYYSFFENNPDAVFTNPTFGDLNGNEWEAFHKKHTTHHLLQFGLIEKE